MAEEPQIGGREPILVEVAAGESYWWCRIAANSLHPPLEGEGRPPEAGGVG